MMLQDASQPSPQLADSAVAPSHDASVDADREDSAKSDVKPQLCLTDDDKDGFGVLPSDAPCPAGEPPAAGDCNDHAATAFPGHSELCGDGLDNDCDGTVDVGTPEKCNGLDDDCDPTTPDGAGACGSFACKGATCLTSCSADTDCASQLHCLSGSCVSDNFGMSCSADGDCTSGACFMSTCVPKVGFELACDSSADCQAGLACTGAGKCKFAPGEACSLNINCASNVCYKTCLYRPSNLDEGCDEQADCASTLTCAMNRCKRHDNLMCTTDAECASGICIIGYCMNKISGLNGACDVTADCAQGLFCDETKKRCKAGSGGVCALTSDCVETLTCTNSICG